MFDKKGDFIGRIGRENIVDGELVIEAESALVDGMFEHDSEIKIVKFHPDWSGTSLRENMFYQSSIEKIVIPKTITSIDDACFNYCKHLKIVEFEKGGALTRIGESSFSSSGLQAIIIPASVIDIGCRAFTACYSLKRVEFESQSQLQRIGRRAFSKTTLGSIQIPDSVTELCDFCFKKTALRECMISENSQLETIGRGVFTDLPHFFVPSKAVNLTGRSLIGVNEVTVSSENPAFVVRDNLLMSTDLTSLYRCFGSLTSIKVARSIRTIKRECFYGRNDITEIEFEEGSELECVERESFANTGLVRIDFPERLRDLGEKILYGCKNLLEVSFHETVHYETSRIYRIRRLFSMFHRMCQISTRRS